MHQKTKEMKTRREQSEQFVAKQKFQAGHRAVIVPDLLLSLAMKRQHGSREQRPDIFHAVDVRVPLDLGVIVIHESIRERVGIRQKREQEQAPQQRSPAASGDIVE